MKRGDEHSFTNDFDMYSRIPRFDSQPCSHSYVQSTLKLVPIVYSLNGYIANWHLPGIHPAINPSTLMPVIVIIVPVTAKKMHNIIKVFKILLKMVLNDLSLLCFGGCHICLPIEFPLDAGGAGLAVHCPRRLSLRHFGPVPSWEVKIYEYRWHSNLPWQLKP